MRRDGEVVCAVSDIILAADDVVDVVLRRALGIGQAVQLVQSRLTVRRWDVVLAGVEGEGIWNSTHVVVVLIFDDPVLRIAFIISS